MSLAMRMRLPALVVAVAAAFLFLRTFVLPATPVLLGGDQGFFWLYGERMLRGDVPYRDFFQFTLPGADVAHLAAFALFGPRVAVTAGLVVALGASLALACFTVARGVLHDAGAALAAALFVVLVFGQSLTTTHHSWSMLFVMVAVAVAGSGRSEARLAGAGALLGVASFCTQTHGLVALAALALFTAWQGSRAGLRLRDVVRRLAMVALAFTCALAALAAYFIHAATLPVVWSCVVSYVVREMGWSAPGWGLGLPEALTARSFPALAPYLVVYATIPTSYVLVARRLWLSGRERVAKLDATGDRLVLLWMTGLALLLEVSSSLSWVRLFAVAWPAMILAAWLLDGTGRRRVYHAIAWVGVVGLAALLVRSTHRHHTVVLDVSGGSVAAEPAMRDELVWLAEHVVHGSLFMTDAPSLYLPLGLSSPIYLDAAVPSSQTTMQNAERAVEELDASRTGLVLWSAIHEQASQDERLKGVRTLASYLHARYHRVRVFEDGDEAWQRND